MSRTPWEEEAPETIRRLSIDDDLNMGHVLRHCVSLCFLAVISFAIYSVIDISTSFVVSDSAVVRSVALPGAVLLLALTCRYATSVLACVRAVFRATLAFSERRWLTLMLAFGLALRAGWILLFPPGKTVNDDPATYIDLALRTATTGEYVDYTSTIIDGVAVAIHPPGYPLILSLLFQIMPSETWAVWGLNALCFILLALLVASLAKSLGGQLAARMAVTIIALWPNLVIVTSIAGKELLLACLVCLAVWLYRRSEHDQSLLLATGYLAGCGATIGAMTLVQPSTALFWTLFAVSDVGSGRKLGSAARRAACMLLMMLIVLAPWSVRNFDRFGAFVPVTTSGGLNLHSANHTGASGLWGDDLDPEIKAMDELTASRVARARAIDWIAQNPIDFAKLAVRKVLFLLGSEQFGGYPAGYSGHDRLHGIVYAVSTAYWLLILLLILSAYVHLYRVRSNFDDCWTILFLPLLYTVAVHAIFESGQRHHVGLSGLLAITASLVLLLSPKPKRSWPPGPSPDTQSQ